MKKIILIIIIIAFCSPAYATIWYVNAGDTNARNQTGYGTAPATPAITPGWVLGQSAFVDYDTMTVYGYRVPTDTNNFYQDFLDDATKSYAVVGVSDTYGDSPTWSNASINIRFRGSYGYVSNCRFVGSGNINGNVWFYYGGGSPYASYVEGCIFDTSYEVESIINASRAASVAYNRDAGTTETNRLENTIFYGRKSPCVSYASTSTTNNSYINNITFYSDSCALKKIGTTALSCTITNSIINADTFIAGYTASNATRIVLSNSDTFGMTTLFSQEDGVGVPVLVFDYATIINGDPLFKYGTTDSRAVYGYLNDGSPCLTQSSDGGLIGVLWGWSASSGATSTVTQRGNFISRWRAVLWRQ